ncbi:protein-ER retention protein [Vanrija albida]|uniref:Protein-ER retention protein n=1 Tax=Vanrija albida TaxID=181172 RepID=A0ABR3Q9T9_9TREE
MDIDTPPEAVEVITPLELPEFSAGFPLPFRVLFLVGLAMLLWAVNLHVLHLLGLDSSWILDIRDSDDALGDLTSPPVGAVDAGEVDLALDTLSLPPASAAAHIAPHVRHALDSPRANTPPPAAARPPSAKLYGPVYRLFLAYAAWCLAGWAVFRAITGDKTDKMEAWRGLVGFIALAPLAAALLPWRGIAYRERRAFRKSIHRILVPPPNAPIFFADVILADILTSFAKVLGDLYVSASQIIFGGITHGRVAPHGASKWITLAMVGLPYLLRFRQCMLEFYHSGWQSKRPLANALKYASAFPVILLSAAQKDVVKEVAAAKGVTPAELNTTPTRWFGEHPVFRLWLLAVVVNSMFSFYWDVEMDWGLSLCELETWLPSSTDNNPSGHLTPASRSTSPPRGLFARIRRTLGRDTHQRSPHPEHHSLNDVSPSTKQPLWGLRQTLLLPDPIVYYLFALLDLILRFTWSLDLSTHLHTISKIESGVFFMEALELVRRWMWVFIRVEWEAVKMGELARFRTGRERTAVLWADKSDDNN